MYAMHLMNVDDRGQSRTPARARSTQLAVRTGSP